MNVTTNLTKPFENIEYNVKSIEFENVAGMTYGIVNDNFEIELKNGQVVPKECYCKFIQYVSRFYNNGKRRPFKITRKD